MLADNAAVHITGSEPDTEDVEEPVSHLNPVSINDRLRYVFIVRHLLDMEDDVEAMLRSNFLRTHRELRCTRSSASPQNQITQFLH